MSADPAWRLPDTDKERIGKVNEYFKSENDLIPDDVPEIGLLDDAILIELVGRALRPELDDYADFCRYRVGEAARLGISPSEVKTRRECWFHERQQEVRLELQLRRVRDTNYGGSTGAGPAFRIC